MNNLVLLYFLIFSVGGVSLLIHYNEISAQRTNFQMPFFSFNTPYSDMPANIPDSLSELDEINDDVNSKVGEILKPTLQTFAEKPVTIDSKNVSSFSNSDTPSTGTDTREEVYVVDYNNIRIQKFDNQGDFILKWGSKGKADGQFGLPHGIDVDKERNVYLVDMDNNNVQKFDSEGNFLLKWGSMGTGDGQFKKPAGLDIDKHDNIYVTDPGNSRIQKFDSNGDFYQHGDLKVLAMGN